MTIRIFSILMLSLLLVLFPVAAPAYQWPVHPSDSQHTIRGTVGETRVDHLHGGVDIPESMGTYVYAVFDGTVVALDSTGILSYVTVLHVSYNPYYFVYHDYVHVEHPVVREDDYVNAGAALAKINNQGHLHFEQDNGFANPLFWLTPFTDLEDPVIEEVSVVKDGTLGTGEPFPTDEYGRPKVSGWVDIKAKAYDPRVYVNGYSAGKGIGVYKVGYEIRDEYGWLWESRPDMYHFDTIADHSVGWIYVPGSTYDPVNFVYWVTNNANSNGAWSTFGLPKGVYTVKVIMEDITGGRGEKEIEVVVPTTTGICITDGSVTGAAHRDTIRWTGCDEVGYGYDIYRSDDCWARGTLLRSVSKWDTLYSRDQEHFVLVDSTVSYSRPYFYTVVAPGLDTWTGSGTPLNLSQPNLPDTTTGLVASNIPADCGNGISLSWQASSGADSYYVFRSSYGNLTDCTVMHDFVGRTAGTSYQDNNALQDVLHSYVVVARNESGSSEASGPDTAIAVRELEGLSLSLSQVSVGNDSIMVCPGGDGDSLAITVRLLDACGEPIVGEPPSSICAVLDSIDGNVTLCFGDTLRPSSATDQGGYTHIVAHHIGGCGKDTVRVYARGQALAQQPLVAFRSPDLNADGTVNWVDWYAMYAGGACTDLNWDGQQKELVDWSLFGAHLQDTSNPEIAVNSPGGPEWWNAGGEKEIAWQLTPTEMNNAYSIVDLVLSLDGGESYTETIGSSLPNNGSYMWSIPQGLSSGECKVKAVARDPHGCNVSDASDSLFTIASVKSGLVTSDTTWASPVSVVGDVTVAQGAHLRLTSGAVVRFDTLDALHSGQDTTKCELIVMGGIAARGTQAKPIEFSSISPSPQAGNWRGIRLRPTSSSDSLDNCRIKYAYTGVEACSTTAVVDSCTISSFTNDGIKAIASTVTLTRDSIQVGSTGVRGIELTSLSSGTVEHNTITGSSSGVRYGIEVKDYFTEPDIRYNWIDGLKHGIKCTDGSPVFWHNRIQGTTGNGIQCSGEAAPSVRYNTIENFQGTAITAADYVLLNLGAYPDSGSNRIYTSQSFSYYVANLAQDPVSAEYNWWGTSNPSSNKFYGDVDYLPCDGSDPGTWYALPLLPVAFAVPGSPYASQSYPNPFNPRTTIEYGVSEPGTRVRIIIYDILGRAVKELVDKAQPAGRFSVSWDGRNEGEEAVASGVYFYEVTIGEFREAKKLVVLK